MDNKLFVFELKSQVNSEFNEGYEEDDRPFTKQSKAEHKMLLQKYGVIPPQLTPSEKNLVLKDERKHGT